MQQDYHVSFKSEETIAKIALRIRRACDIEFSWNFDVTAIIENVLIPKYKKKGPLKTEFYRRSCTKNEPAYVTYEPLTLHVDREIWNLAKAGNAYARLVLAHEIGHIILHDKDAKLFSSDPSLRIRYAQDEYSAEWQAQIFAAYLLLPDNVVSSFKDEEQIIELCAVPNDIARERFFKVNPSKKAIEPYFCLTCENYTMTRELLYLKCVDCGAKRF